MDSQEECNLSINTKKVIIFTHRTKSYSFLSSVYESEFTIDNKRYYHVEGYYQSEKCSNISISAQERVRNIYSPIICAKVSSQYIMSDEKKQQWTDSLKVSIMKKGTLLKFISNSQLTDLLLSTKDSILIEGTADSYWGRGKDGKGRNVMGEILMEIREILKSINRIDY